jgi:hypothetical protein
MVKCNVDLKTLKRRLRNTNSAVARCTNWIDHASANFPANLMTQTIDIHYRPESYFGPRRLEAYLISQVKGAVVRERLKKLLAEGNYDELKNLLGKEGVPKSALKALESVHPMFMGGNYLPDTEEGEVEIARIEIASTTFDVTCLFAKQSNGRILYRVVDEYEGDTLMGLSEMTSEKPLTLGEMADFFLGAWSLIDVLEMNFEGDVESARKFFTAKSEFYPDFDRLCRQRVTEAFPAPQREDEASGDLAAALASEFGIWFHNLGKQGVLPRAFTGVTKDGKQAILILTGLPLDHVQRRDFLIWLCQTEQFVAYAYGTHVGIAETGSMIIDAVDIYASSDHCDVSRTMAVERLNNGTYRLADRHHSVLCANSENGLFFGLHRSRKNFSSDEEALFCNLWTDLKPRSMWQQR